MHNPSMTFEQQMERRSAKTYADFFSPSLKPDDSVLDCGCGLGTITVGLAPFVPDGFIIGIDLRADEFQPAIRHLKQHGVSNVSFCGANIYTLPFAPETFSACFCHSALETLTEPSPALKEIRRVLKPGGLIGIASVEYEGVLLAGAEEPLLRKFYDVREKLWMLEGVAEPRRGKDLRRLLHTAGFGEVRAIAHYLSYGSADEIAAFGADRAADCEDRWYVQGALKHGLLTRTELEALQLAWEKWSKADDSFAAFTWCRATGRKVS